MVSRTLSGRWVTTAMVKWSWCWKAALRRPDERSLPSNDRDRAKCRPKQMYCLMSGILSSIRASFPWVRMEGEAGDRKQAVNTNMSCRRQIHLLRLWSYWIAMLKSLETGHCVHSPASTAGIHIISSCGKAIISKATKTVIMAEMIDSI